MKKLMLGLAAAASLIVISACSSVSSKSVNYASGKSQTGLQYSAPKAMVAIDLIKTGNEISVNISEPFYEGDPNATFTLKASSGAFADQKYRFLVDPNTRLLQTVRSESIGQLDEILVSAAKSAGGISVLGSDESSFYVAGDEGRTLYHRIIDPMMQGGCEFGQPCTLTEVMNDLTAAAAPHIDCDLDDNQYFCAALAKGAPLFKINLTPLFELDSSVKTKKNSRKCSKSICYRAPVPYELRLRMDGVTDISQIVYLPNKGPILGMKIDAGLFSDAKTRVAMVHGMPTFQAAEKGSEFAVAAGVPLRVIDSFFEGTSKVFKLRVDYNSDRADLLESETAIDEAEDARNEFLAERTAAYAANDISEDDLPMSLMGGGDESTFIDDDGSNDADGAPTADPSSNRTPVYGAGQVRERESLLGLKVSIGE